MKKYNNLLHNELLNKKLFLKEKNLFLNKFLNNIKREMDLFIVIHIVIEIF